MKVVYSVYVVSLPGFGCFLCCSFLTRVANRINSKRFGARLSHRKFVRTDDTTQDSEETATAFTVDSLASPSSGGHHLVVTKVV